MKKIKASVLTALILGTSLGARAQDARIGELERKLDVLSQELEKLKLGSAAEPEAEAPAGQAPAATKVYRAKERRVSIGGYGEMTIQDFSKRNQKGGIGGKADEADLLRAVLYFGYKYNDWILFNSELEFEHASTGKGRGEVSVEQAYMDFKLNDSGGLRGGLLLVPMGFMNEIHEPTTFHGVIRPSVERNILPSTWREGGGGFFIDTGEVAFRSYAIAGLQAIKDATPGLTGVRGSDILRNARSSGAKTLAEDPAWVSRLDLAPVPGFSAGGSFYIGEADQGKVVHSVPVTIWELHSKAEYKGLELRGLYAAGRIGNADTVNSANGLTNAAKTSAPRRFFGGYAEGAFNVLGLFETSHYFAPFFRYERYDTQAETPESFAKDPANSRVEYTFGGTYKPIPQIAVKWDYQWMLNQARTGVNQMNLGLGYIF